MSVIAEPNASELIRWMEVPQQPNVFTLGNFARQVTFSSQQTRAFNLIWALLRTNRLAPGRRVAVVGAGLAGMTAAVAALAKECFVDLYEQASQPCPLQRGNDIRFIHPNILRWPEDGSQTAHTDFPFLNWTAASVRGVIKQIDLQWKRHVSNKRLRRLFNYHVSRLYVSPSKAGPQRPWITANRVVDGSVAGDDSGNGSTPGYLELPYDCVILALGFGEERSVVGVPFVSYWENDSLHQETGRGRRSIFVSGCGDGGLIDALRLRLRNFDHADFVRRFLGVTESTFLIGRLQQVESDLRRHASAPDISLRFQSRYDEIAVPKEVEKYFCEEKRADTTVTLNSPSPGPLTFKASLLNRYATYLAVRLADLHYLSGRIVAERAEGGGYRVIVRRDDIGLDESGSFDMVIVRHGPQGVINRLIPGLAATELAAWWEKNEDITTKPYWRTEDEGMAHRFFKEFDVEPVPLTQDAVDLALATYDSAYREYSRDRDVQSVAVGKHDDKAGFIVTLKPNAKPRQSRFYAGVLVQFVGPPVVVPTPATPQVTRPTVPSGARVVSIGAGIYNYTAQQRLVQRQTNGTGVFPPGDFGGAEELFASGIGTLGCFATDTGGALHLISAGSVLSPENDGQAGDKIFLEGHSPQNGDKPIATLAVLQLPDKVKEMNYVDAAAARLEPDVHPDYDPLPHPWRIERAGRAAIDDHVAKVGRTSSFTTGRVRTVNFKVNITMSNTESVQFGDCIMISGTDETTEFSMPGDSGAVIVRKDGTAVGLLVAGSTGSPGNPGVTVACSFERVLQQLGLSLSPTHRPAASRPRSSSRPKKRPSAKPRRNRA